MGDSSDNVNKGKSEPYQDCYCRCHCYYTFDYVSEKKYNWQIVLSDPREDNVIVFAEGVIDGTNGMDL